MRRNALIFLLAIVMVSCGTGNRNFRVDGRLLNLNNGEFYVYSTDGVFSGVDTIKVQGGRFTYDVDCSGKGTLVIVFPNFSEQPVFAEPGKSVNLKGDASHLKQLRVEGTKDNKLMNTFREQVENASPPEMKKYAKAFIEDNPASIVSGYLLNRYFLQTPSPDYKTASALLAKMAVAQPDNGKVKMMQQLVASLSSTAVGMRLPTFKTKTVGGGSVTSDDLSKADVAVISAWANWSSESRIMQNVINEFHSKSDGRLKRLSVCLDPSRTTCVGSLGNDSLSASVVFDGEMFQGKLVRSLGMTSVPDNIILVKGKIVARGLPTDKLRTKLQSLTN